MEGLEKAIHISFIGNNDNTGSGFVSLNFAFDMLSRNHRIMYTTCENDREKERYFKYLKTNKAQNSVTIHKTKIEKLGIITFSPDFDSHYAEKIETMMNNPDEQPDLFIHAINNPLADPYKTILMMSDVWIITLRIESGAVSDYFNMVKKLMMLEKHPSKIFILFNHTKDMERAFELYQKILKETGEFNFSIIPVFLGTVPNDPLRQAYSIKQGIPVRMLFSECSISGAMSFIGDKILGSLV